MDENTRRALEGSIAKWEGIVAGTEGDYGVKNCPLCAEFWSNDCTGCPVAIHTGYSECDKTPYEEWSDNTWHSGVKADTPYRQRIAQQMLDFLKSLLPEVTP